MSTVNNKREKIAFQGDSGIVFRGSGIFYYRYDKNKKITTTLSFMNYWRVKRQLDVGVLASVRDLKGKLLKREQLSFDNGMVINYRPQIGEFESFEGSIEIEIFSAKDMVIPYSAFVAVYEASETISQVHSYTRCLSPHEIEEGKARSISQESCWTVRDDDNIRSFAIFHNGSCEMQGQKMFVKVRNAKGKELQREVDLAKMNPYETVKVFPAELFDNIADFLGGKPGNASIKVKLGNSFSRMLVGNETNDSWQFQATHSNFNYNAIDPTHLSEEDSGYMYVPNMGLRGKEVVIYGERDSGEYCVDGPNFNMAFTGQDSLWFQCDSGMLVFSKKNGAFPARIVTGIAWTADENKIPFECSLGVIQKDQMPKRFWWGMVACDEQRTSKLVMHDLPQIYGGIDKGAKISISLYGSYSEIPLTTEVQINGASDLKKFETGIELDQLFAEAESYLARDFGYYTAFCEYPGLTWYSLVSSTSGSFTLEHGF